MMLLRANAVATDELDHLEPAVFNLAFAEDPDSDGPLLMFQRAAEFDEQDVRLKHDTYCIVTETQATVYGGIETWQLAEGWLKLSLSARAAEALGIDRDLLIQFAPIHTNLVRSALARILALETEPGSAPTPATT
jgi:hypothetical protein